MLLLIKFSDKHNYPDNMYCKLISICFHYISWSFHLNVYNNYDQGKNIQQFIFVHIWINHFERLNGLRSSRKSNQWFLHSQLFSSEIKTAGLYVPKTRPCLYCGKPQQETKGCLITLAKILSSFVELLTGPNILLS